MADARNVLGLALEPCCSDPLTGWYRDGTCRSGRDDLGRHVVCAEMTAEFLEFSDRQGNDLTTPVLGAGFPGLHPGDRWCLCAARWRKALEAGVAPPVILAATEESALQVVSLDQLKSHALDLAS